MANRTICLARVNVVSAVLNFAKHLSSALVDADEKTRMLTLPDAIYARTTSSAIYDCLPVSAMLIVRSCFLLVRLSDIRTLASGLAFTLTLSALYRGKALGFP